MTYCTLQDMIDRGWEEELIQLTDQDNTPATTINETTVASHIRDAVSTVNSYIGKQVTLPLTTIPDALRKATADIARFYLHGDAAEKDSPQERAFAVAIKWLTGVSNGTAIIEDEGVVPAQPGGGRVRTSAPDRQFTRSKLEGF